MRKPYTYRIGWTEHDIYYYGVRWGNSQKEPEQDLWVKYFTSSSDVPILREKLGEPDLIEIRQRFDSKHAARYWEKEVMQRFAKWAPNYLNYNSSEGKNLL